MINFISITTPVSDLLGYSADSMQLCYLFRFILCRYLLSELRKIMPGAGHSLTNQPQLPVFESKIFQFDLFILCKEVLRYEERRPRFFLLWLERLLFLVNIIKVSGDRPTDQVFISWVIGRYDSWPLDRQWSPPTFLFLFALLDVVRIFVCQR